jgi:ADP-heptose:LPS heptosyltransferase
VIHALPAVERLRALSGTPVDWVVQPEYAPLVRRFEPAGRVIEFPRHSLRRAFGAFARALRAVEYDLAVDFQGILKSALLLRVARTRRRVGPARSREGSRLFYDSVPPVAGAGARHAVRANLDIADWLGCPPAAPAFPIRVEPVALAGPRPWMVVCPTSRWPSKNWPAERFVSVGRSFRERTGGTVVLAGSRGDWEVCEGIAAGVGEGARNLAGETDVAGLADLLAAADVVLSNDSGPMHLAAALGRRVVALFGPTDPAITGPVGDGARVLSAPCPRRPCRRRRCGRRPRCMDLISADDALDSVLAALNVTGFAAGHDAFETGGVESFSL